MGHADDHHLIDVVAHKSFATPTQAAAELRRRLDLKQAADREDALRSQQEEAERQASEARRVAASTRRIAFAFVAAALVFIVVLLAILFGGGT